MANLTMGTPSPCDNQDVIFNFYVNFVIIGTLCVCGLVGNTLSFLVLHRDPHNKVAVFLLKSLAMADNLLLSVSFITLSVFLGLVSYMNVKGKSSLTDNIYIYLPIFMDPLGAMAQTTVVWFTVLLALNGFIAVCKPFRARTMCTPRLARIQVALVVACSVCFNFPMFFQHRIQWTYQNRTEPTKELVASEIGSNTTFGIVYTNALYSILVLILPLLLLIGLNCRLILEIRAARRRASNLLGCHSTRAPAQDNISFIMVIIVVVFIVCQTPDRINQVLRLVLFGGDQCGTVKSKLQAFCNLLIIINSSSNFIIYYACRKSFRRILKKRICGITATNDNRLELSKRKSTEWSRARASQCKMMATIDDRRHDVLLAASS